MQDLSFLIQNENEVVLDKSYLEKCQRQSSDDHSILLKLSSTHLSDKNSKNQLLQVPRLSKQVLQEQRKQKQLCTSKNIKLKQHTHLKQYQTPESDKKKNKKHTTSINNKRYTSQQVLPATVDTSVTKKEEGRDEEQVSVNAGQKVKGSKELLKNQPKQFYDYTGHSHDCSPLATQNDYFQTLLESIQSTQHEVESILGEQLYKTKEKLQRTQKKDRLVCSEYEAARAQMESNKASIGHLLALIDKRSRQP